MVNCRLCHCAIACIGNQKGRSSVGKVFIRYKLFRYFGAMQFHCYKGNDYTCMFAFTIVRFWSVNLAVTLYYFSWGFLSSCAALYKKNACRTTKIQHYFVKTKWYLVFIIKCLKSTKKCKWQKTCLVYY